jgi:hypothetical protein
MNNKDQENGERTGPLIFTVPAYGFVMALYLDCLRRSDRAGCFRQKRTVELSDNWAENGEGFHGRGVERKSGSFKDLAKRQSESTSS